MGKALQFIADNKQWIFDGIGGVLLTGVGVVVWSFIKRSKDGSRKAKSQTATVVEKGDGNAMLQQGRTDAGHVFNIQGVENLSIGNAGPAKQNIQSPDVNSLLKNIRNV